MRSVRMNSYYFLDSFNFLPASLDQLTSDLAANKSHPFTILDQMKLYRKHQVKKKELLLKKQVFPYQFVTSLKKLQITKKLPPKKAFFSKLQNCHISDEDYHHAKKVYRRFKVRNMKEYTSLYIQSDVALLGKYLFQKF